ncbi:MAG: urea transporter [Ignavibacteriaceae bacterium]|nr:urea transporter [Ignavibacteriaceae bacterium]
MKDQSLIKLNTLNEFLENRVPLINIILMGLGQVMLQANAITGLLFLIGIFYNSWLLGIAALAGTIVNAVTAGL